MRATARRFKRAAEFQAKKLIKFQSNLSRVVGSKHYNRINEFKAVRAEEREGQSPDLVRKKLLRSNWEQSASVKGLSVLSNIRKHIHKDIKTRVCGVVGNKVSGERMVVRANKDRADIVAPRCKSVMCPVCAPQKSNKRAMEVELLLDRASREGWMISFGTATLNHTRKCSVEEVGDDFKAAWRKARENTQRAVKKELGVELLIESSLDWTYGRNGFHLHNHFLCFVVGGLTEPKRKFIEATFQDKWRAAVATRGRKVSKKAGMKFLPVDLKEGKGEILAKYLTKTSKVAYELTGKATKQAGSGNLTISQIWEGMERGDKRAIAIFHEVAAWFKGKQVFNRSAALTKMVKEEKGTVEIEQEEEMVEVFHIGGEIQREIERKDLYKPLLKLAHRSMCGGEIAKQDAVIVRELFELHQNPRSGSGVPVHLVMASVEKVLRRWR